MELMKAMTQASLGKMLARDAERSGMGSGFNRTRDEQRTKAMEMVARAKGSPMTLPTLTVPLRPYWAREVSIFLNDGECREPYDGIWKVWGSGGGSGGRV